MAKQVKIKDIAQMAGVSAGTVDRILHNRGNVSRESREAVERVLAEVDYKYNIHSSAISLKGIQYSNKHPYRKPRRILGLDTDRNRARHK